MAQVRVSLEDGVHDLVRVEAARRKLTIAQAVAELVGEGLECQEPSRGRREADREMVARRRPAVKPLVEEPWPGEAPVPAADLAVRAAVLAEAKDRPVRSFPKPSQPEKKGRGR